MTKEQTRLAIVILLAVTIAFGLYLGWHFTHVAHHAKDCRGLTAFQCAG